MQLYLTPIKYILCVTVGVILLVLSQNHANSCNTIFYYSSPITKFFYYLFVLFWYGIMHLNIPTQFFCMFFTFLCHCNIFSYLSKTSDISYCSNFWRYVINTPYVFVIIHFVIIVIVHLFINYLCCFELIIFITCMFKPVLLKHSCHFIFLCICSGHYTLPVSYLSLSLSPKYLSDCGNFCSHIPMSCFIFDNG
jgi:hypothetical protein